MTKDFQKYIEQIINLTFGFVPHIRVEEPYVGTVQIFIEGSPDERAMIMGKEGKTITALTRLINCYGRKHNTFCYTYVRPKDYVESNLEDALKVGKYL